MTVIDEIAAERARQIEQEGFLLDHDDAHSDNELAKAAYCYVGQYFERRWLIGHPGDSAGALRAYQASMSPHDWPWDEEWWKPKNPRRDLVRAAALIVAEIERLDRGGQ